MNKLTINDLRVGDLVKIRENSHYYDKDMKYKGFKVIKSINESLGAFKIENKSKGYLDYYYTPEMIAEVKRPCQYKTIYKKEKGEKMDKLAINDLKNEKNETAGKNKNNIKLLKSDLIYINGNEYEVLFENDFGKVCCFTDKEKEIKWLNKSDIQEVERQEIEPDYITIYKREEPILDEEERKYLSTVIKPFRDNVKYISKRRAGAWFKYEYILICSKNEEDDLCFPNFPSQSMYKGMELERKYTIEELGL